jgi:hypothetical protein
MGSLDSVPIRNAARVPVELRYLPMRRDLHELGARESGQHLPSALELRGGWLNVDRVDLQQPAKRYIRDGRGEHSPP